ncbi:DUF4276 family protein [Candidatus Parabeggiatoa sp. HSG14]|uniref:DUF4276 family protein n=1 Tax=Candidatus Parabeggiatoa sp. HSG14 TaxID=3055593 RepID=UPI0025A6EEE3|nr:DUF4276 family protein [Thiotrichales bacterium HSG14]
MKDIKLLLYVEEETDVALVEKILQVAKYPAEQVKILPACGKKNMAHFLNHSWKLNGVKYAALVNFDYHTVFEAVEQAKKQLGDPDAAVFCAVPTLEAWLFADIEAAKKNAYSEHGRKLLERIPLPEEIPYPTRLAYAVFGQKKYKEYALKVFENFDVQKATSRSPSLRTFLEGVGKLLDVQNIPVADVYARSMNRDIFSNLLSEVSSPDTIVYRAMEGSGITAEEMLTHLREGSQVGQQYAVEILRTARDVLARKAQNSRGQL